MPGTNEPSLSLWILLRFDYRNGEREIRMDHETFVHLLNETVPDSSPEKTQLLEYALQLKEMAEAYAQINDPVVHRAKLLYRKHHLKQVAPPTLPQLVRWLRGWNGKDQIAKLEKRLDSIYQYLEPIGMIETDQDIKVSGTTIFMVRSIAQPRDKD